MPAYKLPKNTSMPSVADFAVGGSIAAPMMAAGKAIRRASHPAVKALLEMLGAGPAPKVPQGSPIVEGASQFRIPKTTPIKVPAGFELPNSMRINPARAKGLKAGAREHTKFYNQFKPQSASSKLQKEAPAPAVKALEELQNVAAPATKKTPPPLSTHARSGMTQTNARTKTNPDAVKDMRKMFEKGVSVAKIKQKYPDIHEASIRSIVKRESWNWVK